MAHDRKCVQYYSVRRAVIPFTDSDLVSRDAFRGAIFLSGCEAIPLDHD